jgi:integrase
MDELTQAAVERLTPNPDGMSDRFAWCSNPRGFGVRIKPSGAACFIVQYRNKHGRTRRMALAAVDVLRVADARKRAKVILAAVADGKDPSAEKRNERASATTVKELCEAYMEAARAGRITVRKGRAKKASTVAIDEGRVSRHIVPLLGAKVASTVKRPDIQKLYDDIAAGKTAGISKTKARGVARVTGGDGSAARVIGLLGGIWTWAERRGLVSGSNPARGIETRKGEAKDRVLKPAELKKLADVLDNSPAAVAIRAIALSGCRREEIVRLRWHEIDFDSRCLRLGNTKTGRSMRPLSQAALDVLAKVPRVEDCPFVFPARHLKKPADLKKSIAALFDAAGLKDARAHDLRRTYATAAANLGYSDATIGMLIGHRPRGVTEQHYIRRPDAVLLASADATATIVARSMLGETANVVELAKVRA